MIEYSGPPSLEQRPRDAFRTISIGNLALQHESQVLKSTVVLEAGSSHPYVDLLDRHRADFVREKGWMPFDHKTDFDRYDNAGAPTLSFVETMRGQNDEDIIVSSLRVTEVGINDCMSFEMVDLDFDQDLSSEQQFSLIQAANDKALYDLTRLLPPSDKTVGHKEYLASMVKLFGYAMYYSSVKPNQDPTWVCASEPGFRKLLERLGIASEILKEVGHNAARSDHAVLYRIEPVEALRQALGESEKYTFGLENFRKGVNEARLAAIK